MIDRNKYILAKVNGLADTFRGDEISKRIANDNPDNKEGEGYAPNAQIALAMNVIKDLLNGTQEHLSEFQAYEARRERIKREVDEEIAEIEKTIPIGGEMI